MEILNHADAIPILLLDFALDFVVQIRFRQFESGRLEIVEDEFPFDELLDGFLMQFAHPLAQHLRSVAIFESQELNLAGDPLADLAEGDDGIVDDGEDAIDRLRGSLDRDWKAGKEDDKQE
jgi:hypothetical protein